MKHNYFKLFLGTLGCVWVGSFLMGYMNEGIKYTIAWFVIVIMYFCLSMYFYNKYKSEQEKELK